MDSSQYTTLKAAGAITGISLSGDVVTISAKAFNHNTGQALPDTEDAFSAAGIATQITSYQAQVTALQAAVANLQLLSTDAGVV